jgi:hypothetical protein
VVKAKLKKYSPLGLLALAIVAGVSGAGIYYYHYNSDYIYGEKLLTYIQCPKTIKPQSFSHDRLLWRLSTLEYKDEYNDIEVELNVRTPMNIELPNLKLKPSSSKPQLLDRVDIRRGWVKPFSLGGWLRNAMAQPAPLKKGSIYAQYTHEPFLRFSINRVTSELTVMAPEGDYKTQCFIGDEVKDLFYRVAEADWGRFNPGLDDHKAKF